AQVHGKPRQGRTEPVKLFMLRLDPAHRTARLTALPIAEGSNSLSGIALSPDGSRLAVALGPGGLGPGQEQGIQVVTLRTRAVRTWTWRAPRSNYLGYLVLGANPLSWTADGRMLAFEVIIDLAQRGAHPDLAVRLLDTTAPGDSL